MPKSMAVAEFVDKPSLDLLSADVKVPIEGWIGEQDREVVGEDDERLLHPAYDGMKNGIDFRFSEAGPLR